MLTIKVRRILGETPQPVVFELGACDGRYTEAILAACRTPPLVYCFEPDPRNFPILFQRINPRAITVQAAIGNVSGFTPFYLASPQPNGEIGSSSISPFRDLSKAFEWCKLEKTELVSSWRLDDFCATQYVHFIDLIFMDIQGAERMMIEGAQTMLKATRYLWTEFEGQTIEKEGTCYEHSSSLERLLQLLPGWKVLELLPGDALLVNQQCQGNPHEPVDLLGG